MKETTNLWIENSWTCLKAIILNKFLAKYLKIPSNNHLNNLIWLRPAVFLFKNTIDHFVAPVFIHPSTIRYTVEVMRELFKFSFGRERLVKTN